MIALKLSARRVDSKKETIVFSRSRERSRQNATYARTRCAKVSRSRIGRVMAPQCSRTAALRNDSLLPRHRISKKIREKDKIHIGVKDKLVVE